MKENNNKNMNKHSMTNTRQMNPININKNTKTNNNI